MFFLTPQYYPLLLLKSGKIASSSFGLIRIYNFLYVFLRFYQFFFLGFYILQKRRKKKFLCWFFIHFGLKDAYLSVYKSLCFYGNIKRTFKRCLIALFRMDFYWFVSRFIRIDVKWNGELRRFLLPSGLLKIYRLMSCAGHFYWFNKRSLGSKLIHLASFPLHSSRSTLKSKKFS